MKKPTMGGFLRAVSIVVAAGTLISAIFTKDEDKKLKEMVDESVQNYLSSKE